jgi:hypothetical protein
LVWSMILVAECSSYVAIVDAAGALRPAFTCSVTVYNDVK